MPLVAPTLVMGLLRKKKKELSEYKAMYMIKDYLPLLHEAIQKDTQEISKILLCLFPLPEKNARKSHRYEKKTVFDILGVVYHYTTSNKKAVYRIKNRSIEG